MPKKKSKDRRKQTGKHQGRKTRNTSTTAASRPDSKDPTSASPLVAAPVAAPVATEPLAQVRLEPVLPSRALSLSSFWKFFEEKHFQCGHGLTDLAAFKKAYDQLFGDKVISAARSKNPKDKNMCILRFGPKDIPAIVALEPISAP